MDLKRINDYQRVHKMPICVDFDNTIVIDAFPQVGPPVPYALDVLKRWSAYGAGIVLTTMRSEQQLDDAVLYLRQNGLELYGIQKDPFQDEWTTSPKCNGIFCVDDRNIGCPLIEIEGNKVVDWKTIMEQYNSVILNAIKNYNFGNWLKKVNDV